MIFTAGTLYTEELVLAFGALDPARLSAVLRDGRPTSYLLHAHLLSKFSNLRPAPVKLSDAVVDDLGQVFLVRVVTENGTKLLPSKNIGVGRNYDPDDYRAALKQLSGFLLIDVTQMPRIRYGTVVKDIIPFRASFTYLDAISLLKLSEKPK